MVDDFFEKLGRCSHSAAHKLHIKSALNPMLWLCASATPTCLFAAHAFKDIDGLCLTLVIAGLTPIAVACLGFIYFAFKKPEKLQSEDYQIRHETLQIIQQKTGSISVSPASIVAIANPIADKLEKGGGQG